MDMERVTQPVEGWFGFIRANLVELFKGLLRVNLYAMAAVVLAMLAIGAGGAAVYFTSAGMLGWALLAICSLVAIILMIIARLFGLASYKVVEEQHGAKQKVDIVAVAKQKAIPAIIYGLIMAVIYAIVLIPLGVVGLGLAALTGIPQMLSLLIQLGLGIVGFVLGFFLQFALLELVLADKGPIESIRASLGLVKRNFWETIIFYIVRVIVSWIVSLPFMLILVVAIIIGVLLGMLAVMGIAVTASGTVSLIVWGLAIVLVLLFIIPYSLAYNSANETAVLSLAYRYWRTIRGDIDLEKRPVAASVTGTPTGAPGASESRAMTTTVESPVMVAPVAGTLAAMPEAKPEAPAKKAPPKKPAAKKKSP